jgi:pre-mRNA-splicing factor CWC22
LQTILNVFREDPEYEAHEAQYRAIIKELLGDDDDDEEEGGEGDGSGESSRAEQQGCLVHGVW